MLNFDLLKSVIMTEKVSVLMTNTHKCYAFKVTKNAQKKQIQKVVEDIYSVKVKSVNTLNAKGKVKIHKGRQGCRSDFKKAYVTLQAGHDINISESI